jgi:hypothetical protein
VSAIILLRVIIAANIDKYSKKSKPQAPSHASQPAQLQLLVLAKRNQMVALKIAAVVVFLALMTRVFLDYQDRELKLEELRGTFDVNKDNVLSEAEVLAW